MIFVPEEDMVKMNDIEIEFILRPVQLVGDGWCPHCKEDFAVYENDTELCPRCSEKLIIVSK